MLLFKEFHIPLIRQGIKTATRRYWPKGPRVRVGSVHRCQTRLFTPEYFAKVQITKCYRARLKDMTDGDYSKEGGYTSETFVAAWTRINRKYDPEDFVWVVEFEVVE